MSSTKKDRKIQSHLGRMFPDEGTHESLGSGRFAAIVADALQREFGEAHGAVKIVVGLTHANERAVKNWFSAKNGPRGPHLIALMRHSDVVLETFLALAGRKDLLTAKKLLDAREKLQQIMELLDDLQRQE